MDAQAKTLGLQVGGALADARALHPDLSVLDMDENADAAWLMQLAQACVRYSPLVAPEPPDSIIIDVSGAVHPYENEEQMLMEITEHMTRIGMTSCTNISNTPDAAVALAKYGKRQNIRSLPVSALNINAESIAGLQRAGLKHIGDMAARPASAIAARFGMDTLTKLQQLLGEAPRPILPLVHDKPLMFERRFAEPVGHHQVVSDTLLALLEQAAREMAERHVGGRSFRLTLYRSDGQKRTLAIATGAPTRDPALVARLFDERIDTLSDPIDPGFGFDSISLDIPAYDPLSPVQVAFDSDADIKDQIALRDLIDRLSTRLGAGAVRCLMPGDSHIPEQAQLALPAAQVHPPRPWPKPPAEEPAMRPFFLLDPPQKVEVIAEVPDGPPHRFRWRRKLHEVRLYEGPERIAAEWWRKAGGESAGKGGLTRDYYRIEDARGRRYWIFRHGLYEEKRSPLWYLHGLFA